MKIPPDFSLLFFLDWPACCKPLRSLGRRQSGDTVRRWGFESAVEALCDTDTGDLEDPGWSLKTTAKSSILRPGALKGNRTLMTILP